MVSKPERRRRIFLTARTVFVGPSARIRDRKDIRPLISRHPDTFRQLNSAFGVNVVVDVIWSLLESGVFESELRAKLAFPELYQVSAVRTLQHDVSEQNAARSEAEAFDSISHADSDIYQDDIYDRSEFITGWSPNSMEFMKLTGLDIQTSKDPLREQILDLPSLYPTYLTYQVQHELLNTVQRLLEECCYEWARRWIPDLLEERKWTCSEAVELSQWAKVLPRRFDKTNDQATSLESGDSLKSALVATHQLRHAAVHRLPTSAKGIKKMLGHALFLANALHDTTSTFKLDALLSEFDSKVRDMELHKNELENGLDDEMNEIQEQRAILEKREREAKANMIKQDGDNTRELSWLFAKSLRDLTREQGPAMVDGVEAKLDMSAPDELKHNHTSNNFEDPESDGTQILSDMLEKVDPGAGDQARTYSEEGPSMHESGDHGEPSKNETGFPGHDGAAKVTMPATLGGIGKLPSLIRFGADTEGIEHIDHTRSVSV